jgi:hypothetical protein
MNSDKLNNYDKNKKNLDANDSFKKKLGTLNDSKMDFDDSLSVIKKDELNDSRQSNTVFKVGGKNSQIENFETYDSTNRDGYPSPISQTKLKKRKLVKKLNQSAISSERSDFASSFRKREMLNDTNGNILNKGLDESSITMEEKDIYMTTGNDNSFTNHGYLASEEKLRNLVKKAKRTPYIDKMLKRTEMSMNDVQNTNNAILNVGLY